MNQSQVEQEKLLSRQSNTMNELELTGRANTHVVTLTHPQCAIHYAAATSILAMHDAAREAGIQLSIRSGFRDFDTQLSIWNRKWRGERVLYARDGTVLNHASLTPDELLEAILIGLPFPVAAAITGVRILM